MAFVLHRYIFRELAKVFCLSTLALTVILSLGSLLQPIQRYGVGPGQVPHLLGYFLPVTLTFVLPLAALLSSALVYGRLAGDNEIEACKASGLSPLTLVYPGLVLAILVAIANLLLSFHVMPYFVLQAERAIKADAKQILFRNIQRRGFYRVPPGDRYVVYADYADPVAETLFGVVVVKTRQGHVEQVVAAETARVTLDSKDQYTEVRITAQNTMLMGQANDLWFQGKTVPIGGRLGSLLGDRINFKRLHEMKAIQADPLCFRPIENSAREAAAQFLMELLAQDVERGLKTRVGYEMGGEPNSLRIWSWRSSLGADRSIMFAGEVEVVELDNVTGRVIKTLRCEKAVLRLEGEDRKPALALDIYNAGVAGSSQILMRDTMRGLVFPQAMIQKVFSGGLLRTLTPQYIASALVRGPGPDLVRLQKNLDREIRIALADIRAEIQSRLVFGIGCIPMILIGIGLGILKREGHLLSAFAASCVPAMILVVAIISGKQITENPDSHGISGPLLMWAGLAILGLLMLEVYRRLLRH